MYENSINGISGIRMSRLNVGVWFIKCDFLIKIVEWFILVSELLEEFRFVGDIVVMVRVI